MYEEKIYQDKVLTCKECGQEFVFPAGEQQFYAEKASRTSRSAAKSAETQERMRVSPSARCSIRLAHVAAGKQEFLSSLRMTGRYIAASATQC